MYLKRAGGVVNGDVEIAGKLSLTQFDDDVAFKLFTNYETNNHSELK